MKKEAYLIAAAIIAAAILYAVVSSMMIEARETRRLQECMAQMGDVDARSAYFGCLSLLRAGRGE